MKVGLVELDLFCLSGHVDTLLLKLPAGKTTVTSSCHHLIPVQVQIGTGS